MARHTFEITIAAPPEVVFDLWTNLDRMKEWVGGVTKVSEVSGPLTQVGTRYVVWFGSMRSASEVVEVERPRRFAARFGNRILRGLNQATFEPDGGGTRLTETLETEGLIPAIMGRIFAIGSYRGSFRGELAHFGRLAEAEARATVR